MVASGNTRSSGVSRSRCCGALSNRLPSVACLSWVWGKPARPVLGGGTQQCVPPTRLVVRGRESRPPGEGDQQVGSKARSPPPPRTGGLCRHAASALAITDATEPERTQRPPHRRP